MRVKISRCVECTGQRWVDVLDVFGKGEQVDVLGN